jgi:hypothetical protein
MQQAGGFLARVRKQEGLIATCLIASGWAGLCLLWPGSNTIGAANEAHGASEQKTVTVEQDEWPAWAADQARLRTERQEWYAAQERNRKQHLELKRRHGKQKEPKKQKYTKKQVETLMLQGARAAQRDTTQPPSSYQNTTQQSTGPHLYRDEAHPLVYLGVDEEALDGIVNAAVHEDPDGVNDLIRQDRVFACEGGIAVKIIGGSGFLQSKIKIRLLEGVQAGRAGWVPREFVKG